MNERRKSHIYKKLRACICMGVCVWYVYAFEFGIRWSLSEWLSLSISFIPNSLQLQLKIETQIPSHLFAFFFYFHSIPIVSLSDWSVLYNTDRYRYTLPILQMHFNSIKSMGFPFELRISQYHGFFSVIKLQWFYFLRINAIHSFRIPASVNHILCYVIVKKKTNL